MPNTTTTPTACPDCEEIITADNPLIEEFYNPERWGSCLNCYDPTPW